MATLKPLSADAQEFFNSLSPAAQAKVQKLREIQQEHQKLEDQMEGEIRVLQQKYDALYVPLYKSRKDIVNSPEGGIPDFWLTALSNLQAIGDIITEKDREALHFLQDVTSEELPDNRGFRLHFHFAENPFFTNTVLTKTYTMPAAHEHSHEEGAACTASHLPTLEGTKIEWKPSKNLAVKLVKKKQRHKNRGEVRVVTKEEPSETFFNFFNPPDISELDGEEQETAHDLMEMDLDLGYIIHEKIIPNAVKWYTGQALEEEDMFEDDFEDGEDEFDDEDDEDDDEEEEEEEKPKGGKKAAQKKQQPSAGGQQQAGQPECKQQ